MRFSFRRPLPIAQLCGYDISGSAEGKATVGTDLSAVGLNPQGAAHCPLHFLFLARRLSPFPFSASPNAEAVDLLPAGSLCDKSQGVRGTGPPFIYPKYPQIPRKSPIQKQRYRRYVRLRLE